MKIEIELPAGVAKVVQAAADATGQTVNEYVLQLLSQSMLMIDAMFKAGVSPKLIKTIKF